MIKINNIEFDKLTKSVTAYGIPFDVLYNINYLAIDGSGYLYGYEYEPFLTTINWTVDQQSKMHRIGRVNFYGDWKNSLVKV